MSTHNIQLHDRVRKFHQNFNICFLKLSEEFAGTKTEFESAMVNEPSMFELLRFTCNCSIRMLNFDYTQGFWLI